MIAAPAAKYTSEADPQYLPHADPSSDVAYAIRPEPAMTGRLADDESSQRRRAR